MAVTNDAFYDKFRYDRYDFENMFNTYKRICDKLQKQVTAVEDNLYLSSTETYRIIPLQYVNIEDAQYNVENAYTEIGSDKAAKLRLRLSGKGVKNTLDNSDLISYLDKMGYYIKFTGQRLDGEPEPEYKIESFELFDNFGKLLSPGVDYFFDNNKLYLFGEYAYDKKYTQGAFTLKNIAISIGIFENSISQNLDIKKTDRVPKSIFTETVKRLTLYALKASKIGALNSSAKEVFGQNIEVADMYSTNQDIISIYKNNKYLTPYDFVVYADESIDRDFISIYNQYLKKAKFCETNFITMLHGDFTEDALDYEDMLTSDADEILTENYAQIESKGEYILTNTLFQHNTTYQENSDGIHRVTFHTGEVVSGGGIGEILIDDKQYVDAGGLTVNQDAESKTLLATDSEELKNIEVEKGE